MLENMDIEKNEENEGIEGIEEYIILHTAYSPGDPAKLIGPTILQGLVNNKIKEGYHPQGGICINGHILYQAMIKVFDHDL
jgi:hypothetical protein